MPVRPCTPLRRLTNAAFPAAAVLSATLLCAAAIVPALQAQVEPLLSPTVPGHYLVIFRNGTAAESIGPRFRHAGISKVTVHPHLGTAAIEASAEAMHTIAADPTIQSVVQDRMVYAHTLLQRSTFQADGSGITIQRASPPRSILVDPLGPVGTNGGNNSSSSSGSSSSNGTSSTSTGSSAPQWTPTDTFYTNSPQGWAVRAAGGYGNGILGSTASGPWNRSLGSGVRIAVLDSGIDAAHPDIAPNLGFNLSEVDTNAQPSPCDDGSPQDQQGHGTWVASLAAGAMGASTGRVVGVAPSATLLNIKVLQRMPGIGSTVAAQCASGQAAGLVSWLLKGIDDAVQQHADIIVLSLGSIVDLYTGDGAGLKSAFDRVTHAAASAGVLIVAAAGNEAFDLSNPRYLQLPAQARDVIAITASTNPACAENNSTGAACAAGAVTMPYYSNFGAPLQAVAAPGGNYPVGGDEAVSGWIRGACSSGKPSTVDGLPSDSTHSFGCFNLGHVQYVQAMGTSASAGLAAGAAALLRAAHPGWTPANVALALRSTATVTLGGKLVLNTAAALDFQP